MNWFGRFCRRFRPPAVERNLLYRTFSDDAFSVGLPGVFDKIIVPPGQRLVVEVKLAPASTDMQPLIETNVWRESEPVEETVNE